MSIRKFMVLAIGLLFATTSVGIADACDVECKPGEVYSDDLEQCVPVKKPLT